MRQIIFSNGDIVNISDRSNHLDIIYENVASENLLALLTMDKSIWHSFTIRRITERDTKDFPYTDHVLDHYELDGNGDVHFILRQRSEEEIYKEALDILMGGDE